MGEKQALRRKEILEAALQAFSETGYDKTSMDDVVRATGLSKGTIYWYFKNKQEMFTALMEHVIDQFMAEFEGILTSARTMPPSQAITAIFEQATTMLDMNPRVAAMTVDFMLQALHYPEMRHKYAGYYAHFIDELGTIIQYGVDAGVFRRVDARSAAAALIGMMDGIILQALLADEISLEWQWRVTDIMKTAETVFLTGLVKGGDQ